VIKSGRRMKLLLDDLLGLNRIALGFGIAKGVKAVTAV
jgi:hypothetical protein